MTRILALLHGDDPAVSKWVRLSAWLAVYLAAVAVVAVGGLIRGWLR